MVRLYLVQHGDAVAKDLDPDRPLSDAGRDDVERVATLLARAGVRVARVAHSGKPRARESAEILAAAIDAPAPRARSGLDPEDPVDALAGEAHALAADAMLVGHLPFMGRLAARLLGAGDDATPALVCQGERDALGRREEVEGYRLSARIRLHWLPDGDHSFKPRNASGHTEAGNLADAAAAIVAFAEGL